MVVAVVPAKNLGQAKSRLASVLSDAERQGLVRAMLADVLGALLGADGVEGIFVVADEAPDLPDGVTLIQEPENRGYDVAVVTALTDPRVADADAMLVLPSDLPLATAEDIDRFIAPPVTQGIRIAGVRDGDGTNALLVAPPGLMATSFGPGSFTRHKQVAAALGHTITELSPPGLAFDIDTPQDLLDFRARGSETATHAFLVERGVADRLTGTG